MSHPLLLVHTYLHQSKKKKEYSFQIWLQAWGKEAEVVNDLLLTNFHLLNLDPLRDLYCLMNEGGLYTISSMSLWKYTLHLFEISLNFGILC